jgi:hypothetical protein
MTDLLSEILITKEFARALCEGPINESYLEPVLALSRMRNTIQRLQLSNSYPMLSELAEQVEKLRKKVFGYSSQYCAHVLLLGYIPSVDVFTTKNTTIAQTQLKHSNDSTNTCYALQAILFVSKRAWPDCSCYVERGIQTHCFRSLHCLFPRLHFQLAETRIKGNNRVKR